MVRPKAGTGVTPKVPPKPSPRTRVPRASSSSSSVPSSVPPVEQPSIDPDDGRPAAPPKPARTKRVRPDSSEDEISGVDEPPRPAGKKAKDKPEAPVPPAEVPSGPSPAPKAKAARKRPKASEDAVEAPPDPPGTAANKSDPPREVPVPPRCAVPARRFLISLVPSEDPPDDANLPEGHADVASGKTQLLLFSTESADAKATPATKFFKAVANVSLCFQYGARTGWKVRSPSSSFSLMFLQEALAAMIFWMGGFIVEVPSSAWPGLQPPLIDRNPGPPPRHPLRVPDERYAKVQGKDAWIFTWKALAPGDKCHADIRAIVQNFHGPRSESPADWQVNGIRRLTNAIQGPLCCFSSVGPFRLQLWPASTACRFRAVRTRNLFMVWPFVSI